MCAQLCRQAEKYEATADQLDREGLSRAPKPMASKLIAKYGILRLVAFGSNARRFRRMLEWRPRR